MDILDHLTPVVMMKDAPLVVGQGISLTNVLPKPRWHNEQVIQTLRGEASRVPLRCLRGGHRCHHGGVTISALTLAVAFLAGSVVCQIGRALRDTGPLSAFDISI
jgi:hypothetical protein